MRSVVRRERSTAVPMRRARRSAIATSPRSSRRPAATDIRVTAPIVLPAPTIGVTTIERAPTSRSSARRRAGPTGSSTSADGATRDRPVARTSAMSARRPDSTFAAPTSTDSAPLTATRFSAPSTTRSIAHQSASRGVARRAISRIACSAWLEDTSSRLASPMNVSPNSARLTSVMFSKTLTTWERWLESASRTGEDRRISQRSSPLARTICCTSRGAALAPRSRRRAGRASSASSCPTSSRTMKRANTSSGSAAASSSGVPYPSSSAAARFASAVLPSGFSTVIASATLAKTAPDGVRRGRASRRARRCRSPRRRDGRAP
jgi:hypothetical protein